MAGGTNVVPQSSNNTNANAGYDAVNKQVAANRLTNVQQDTNNYYYGDQGVAIADGANVSQGSTTDVVWSGTGAATQIALLKKLVAELGAALTVTGSVGISSALPAGTNTIGTMNQQLTNPITSTYEIQKSAAGTLDNSNGQGVADTISYLFNGITYDRARSLQAKSYCYGTVSGITVGQNTAIFAAGSIVPSIQPGMQIQFLGTAETLIVSNTYVPTTSTTAPQTVTFQTNFAYTHTSAQFSGYTPGGPTTTGFLADGVLASSSALFDPGTYLYYVPFTSSQDAIQGKNLPVSTIALYNGATHDRAIGKNGVQEISSGGHQTTAIAAAAAASAIKASAGRLARILVTTAGTAALTLYDNASAASGTIIGYVPANATAGTIYDSQMPAANGIWCASGTNTPAITVSWT